MAMQGKNSEALQDLVQRGRGWAKLGLVASGAVAVFALVNHNWLASVLAVLYCVAMGGSLFQSAVLLALLRQAPPRR